MTETGDTDPADPDADGRRPPVPDEADLREVRGAVALVAAGQAVAVIVCGLRRPAAFRDWSPPSSVPRVPVHLEGPPDHPGPVVVGPLDS